MALENDIGTLENTIIAYLLMIGDLNIEVDLSQ
jgi:hypothetical protein